MHMVKARLGFMRCGDAIVGHALHRSPVHDYGAALDGEWGSLFLKQLSGALKQRVRLRPGPETVYLADG